MKPLQKPKEPKRTRSSYFLWCDSVRAASTADPELSGRSMAVVSKVLAGRWKLLSPEDKKPFEERSAKLKEEFKMKHVPPMPPPRVELPEGWKAVRDTVTNTVAYLCVITGRSQWEKPGAGDAQSMPPRPQSARRAFELALLEAGKKLPPRDVTVLWKALPQDKLELYKTIARNAKTTYKQTLKSRKTAMQASGQLPPTGPCMHPALSAG
jgi:hypothetical protein